MSGRRRNKILQRFPREVIYICIIVLAALIVFVIKESRGYNIVEYYIGTDKDIEPFRFVMISDLHDTDVSHDNNRGLLASIDGIAPDFVILAGDMITSYKNKARDPQRAYDFLKNLAATHTVYYGLGNHEQRYMAEPERYPGRFDRLKETAEKAGIHFLSDEYIRIDERRIGIYGFNIPIENYKRAVTTHLAPGILNDTFGAVNGDDFNILIAHHPGFFEEYAGFGVDLVLAGHLHGGIVAIPGIGGVISPQLKLFPKYDFGKYDRNDTTMIVSRGIGWHSIPVRIFNKAEIVSITVGPKRGIQNGN